ncbi:hypothetical protein RSAG8_12106, partial [Rhizoctonia solani AG-8 WAC10335]
MRPYGTYPGIQTDNVELDASPIPILELRENSNNVPAQSSMSESTGSTTRDSPSLVQELEDDESSIEHLVSETSSGTPESTSTDGGAKSTDRLRRVRGYTRYPNATPIQTDSVQGDQFQVSDLAATFVLAEDRVALLILRVTSIVASDGRLLEAISKEHFTETGITFSGQPLELNVAAIGTSAYRKRDIGFDFAARMSRPVNPELVELGEDRVWGFSHAQMTKLMDELWAVCARVNVGDDIPHSNTSTTFPYQTNDGQIVLFHPEATDYVQKAIRPAVDSCLLCGERVNIKRDMRTHVGRHILSLQSGSSEGSNTIHLAGFVGGAIHHAALE